MNDTLATHAPYERHVDLVRLIVPGHGVHRQVDAEAVGQLALPLAARHGGVQRPAELVDRERARKDEWAQKLGQLREMRSALG